MKYFVKFKFCELWVGEKGGLVGYGCITNNELTSVLTCTCDMHMRLTWKSASLTFELYQMLTLREVFHCC